MSKRTLAEFEPLLAGEETLLKGLSSGEFVPIGGTTVPDVGAGEKRQVRGEFLRYLLLGGCDGLNEDGIHVHEKGVRIVGALITDVLDLEGCRIPRDIALVYCRFQQTPVLRSAQIDNLFLNGSVLPGLKADGLEAKGGVVLRGVVATGAVRLLGAKLGGDLDCAGAQLTAVKGGDALLLDRVRIEGAFFLRDKAQINGVLDLSGATLGAIIDEEDCWPDAGNLVLNRCQYGAFVGKAPVTADARIKWLGLQYREGKKRNFWPQPWEQCAKVLREMGHGDDARAVLIDKEKRQRADRRARLWRTYMREDYYWHSIWDWVLGVTVRYGHQPLLAFVWLFGFWFIGGYIFATAEQYDAIKPNDVRILRSAEWAFCHPDYAGEGARNTGTSQIDCFLDQPEAASYPRFNAWVYSADTLLPIVALEMQSFWIPDETAGWVGQWARYFLWLQIISGWGLSLLAVAGFSGLIKSD